MYIYVMHTTVIHNDMITLTRIKFPGSHSLISLSLISIFWHVSFIPSNLGGLQFSDVATISGTLASYYLSTFQQNKCSGLIIFKPYVFDIIHQYSKEASGRLIWQRKSSHLRARRSRTVRDPVCYDFGGEGVRGDLSCTFPCLVWLYGTESLCFGVI